MSLPFVEDAILKSSRDLIDARYVVIEEETGFKHRASPVYIEIFPKKVLMHFLFTNPGMPFTFEQGYFVFYNVRRSTQKTGTLVVQRNMTIRIKYELSVTTNHTLTPRKILDERTRHTET